MKKLIALTLCTVMALTMAACGTDNAPKELGGDPATWGTTDNKDVEIPNPFEEYETLSEAEKAAGFEFSIPDAIPGYENRQFRATKQKLIAEEREDLSFVWEAVKELPDKYREVIHLHYYEGYPTAHIAKILKRNESTIRSDLRRGRERLKEVLKEAYDFE